jgi:hypothetical protein
MRGYERAATNFGSQLSCYLSGQAGQSQTERLAMQNRICVIMFAIAVHIPSAAFASINLTIDSGYVDAFANSAPSISQSFLDTAGFAINGLTRTATSGDLTATATYNWSNTSGTAILEVVANSLSIHAGGLVHVLQIFTFTLDEPAFYSIDGRLAGLSHDVGDRSFLEAFLRIATAEDYIGYEYDTAELSIFDLLIDGVQQGNASFTTEGQLNGQLEPGWYFFSGILQLAEDYERTANTDASGFIRLTLTAVNAAAAPEPLSLLVWGGLLACGTVVHTRVRARPRRRDAPMNSHGIDRKRRSPWPLFVH